jgi:protein ImuA
MNTARLEILTALTHRLQTVESVRPLRGRSSLSLGLRGLDDLLPEEGLPPGSLVELLSDTDGAGVWTLSLLMGWHACGGRRTLVVADPERCFYPPAATKLGIDLPRTLIIRPRTWPDTYVALEQSLRCSAVGAVIGRCDRLRFADCRRLQLAAEAGGGLGLLLRPEETRGAPSFAALRLGVTPVGPAARARHVRIDVLRCRGTAAGRSVILEIDHETGHVRVPAKVAAAAAVAR